MPKEPDGPQLGGWVIEANEKLLGPFATLDAAGKALLADFGMWNGAVSIKPVLKWPRE